MLIRWTIGLLEHRHWNTSASAFSHTRVTAAVRAAARSPAEASRASQLLEAQHWHTIAGAGRFFSRIYSPGVAAIFSRWSAQGRVAGGMTATRQLASIVAVDVG